MKVLKIIMIILGVLVAAILVVPLFTPATAVVHAEVEIALEPSQIFPSVASFENRQIWDPWVTQDSTTLVKIESKPGYVGSIYTWEGEKLGKGKMEVQSVKEDRYIESSLWFGEVEEPSLVEWHFTPVGGATKVEWTFTQETKYPIGRLGMIFGKIFLKQSFEMGLENLKTYLEERPKPISSLSPVSVEVQPAFLALVADGAGSMETIGEQLGSIFGLVYAEIEKQRLQVTGAMNESDPANYKTVIAFPLI